MFNHLAVTIRSQFDAISTEQFVPLPLIFVPLQHLVVVDTVNVLLLVQLCGDLDVHDPPDAVRETHSNLVEAVATRGQHGDDDLHVGDSLHQIFRQLADAVRHPVRVGALVQVRLGLPGNVQGLGGAGVDEDALVEVGVNLGDLVVDVLDGVGVDDADGDLEAGGERGGQVVRDVGGAEYGQTPAR